MKLTDVDITPKHITKVKAPYEIQQEGNVSFFVFKPNS